ncbi:MAG: glycosyltransferase family 2 protein [Ignavibacteriaceae bacterium]|jgi:hypothetical protein|nr:glycosyltransferase family 2 protein [Ignavibacteriaceae bacterium]
MNNIEYDVSIVIITWKMRDLLQKCLDSIYQYTKEISFELILIDNCSNDGTVELIEQNFPNINLIKNNENKGVAPARNQGMKITKGKYILILDADMELTEDSISQMFNFIEKKNSCGIVGCKLIDSGGKLQYSCKRFPTLAAFFFRRLEKFSFIRNSKTLKQHTMSDWAHDESQKVDYLIGACQFIKRSVIEQIGYYDDKIFYGPEDIDYCLRTWHAGWEVWYYPFTKIFHHEQRITKQKFFSKIAVKHFLGINYLFKKYQWKLNRYNE